MIYKTVTVDGQLAPSTVNASASLSDNLNAEAKFTTNIRHASVSDYDLLQNKPQINSVELMGNKSLPEIGVDTISNVDLENMLK